MLPFIFDWNNLNFGDYFRQKHFAEGFFFFNEESYQWSKLSSEMEELMPIIIASQELDPEQTF